MKYETKEKKFQSRIQAKSCPWSFERENDHLGTFQQVWNSCELTIHIEKRVSCERIVSFWRWKSQTKRRRGFWKALQSHRPAKGWDWFFKGSLGKMSATDRRQLVVVAHPRLSLSKQCALLEVTRSQMNYKPKGESVLNDKLTKSIDRYFCVIHITALSEWPTIWTKIWVIGWKRNGWDDFIDSWTSKQFILSRSPLRVIQKHTNTHIYWGIYQLHG